MGLINKDEGFGIGVEGFRFRVSGLGVFWGCSLENVAVSTARTYGKKSGCRHHLVTLDAFEHTEHPKHGPTNPALDRYYSPSRQTPAMALGGSKYLISTYTPKDERTKAVS